jgi:hypothetical protein
MQGPKENALGVPAFGSVALKELALLSLLTEFLDWVLIFGKRHFRSALSECVDHYNVLGHTDRQISRLPNPASGTADPALTCASIDECNGGLITSYLRGRVMHDRVSVPHLDYLPAAVDEGVNSELRLLRRLLPRPRSRPLTRRHRAFASSRHLAVHITFELALFRFCSSDERNTRQHLDMSRHLGKQA